MENRELEYSRYTDFVRTPSKWAEKNIVGSQRVVPPSQCPIACDATPVIAYCLFREFRENERVCRGPAQDNWGGGAKDLCLYSKRYCNCKQNKTCLSVENQWQGQEFSFEEQQPKGSGGQNSPVGSRGKAPVADMGDRPEAKAVGRQYLMTLTAEMIKVWKFRTIHLLILDLHVSPRGLSYVFFFGGGGLVPLTHAWRRHSAWAKYPKDVPAHHKSAGGIIAERQYRVRRAFFDARWRPSVRVFHNGLVRLPIKYARTRLMVSAGHCMTVEAQLKSVWVVRRLGPTTRYSTVVHIVRTKCIFHLRTGHVRVDSIVRVIL